MIDALWWYVAVQAIGVAVFPVSYALLPRLSDRGHSVSKPLGPAAHRLPVLDARRSPRGPKRPADDRPAAFADGVCCPPGTHGAGGARCWTS